jgi:hypothetical protein
MSVIDLDDYDANCRRPRLSDDPALGCGRNVTVPVTGLLSTSQEVSCNVVQRHRQRSAAYFTNVDQAGRHSPALLTFPILYDKDGTAIVSDPMRPETAKLLPKLLGPALVAAEHDEASWPLLGTVLSSTATPNAGLSSLPDEAVANWVAFDLRAPRAHTTQMWTVTYEGTLPWFIGRRGRLQCAADKSDLECETGDDPSHLEVFDSSVGFCDGGAQGEDMKLGDRPAGDIFEIIEELPDPADPYWTSPKVAGVCSRQDCEEVFGTLEAPRVVDTGAPVGRDILIEKSFQGRLSLKPSVTTKQDADGKLRRVPVSCCFPYPVAYTIRANDQWIVSGQSTGFAHRLIPDPAETDPIKAACIESCDPNLALRNGRLRARAPSEAVPTYDSNEAFHNAQMRFVLWDMEQTSCMNPPCSGRVRDRYFSFQEVGGFLPMRFSLSSTSLVLPQSVRYVRGLQMLAVPDPVQMGLILVDLNLLRTTLSFY